MSGATAPGLLLLEPDVLARYPLAAYLRACGYVVLEAASAEEARVLLDQAGVGVDIAFLDATADGAFELRQWITAQHRGVDIVMVGSIAAAARKAEEVCESGPTLGKPYEGALVVDLIKRLRAARARAAKSFTRD